MKCYHCKSEKIKQTPIDEFEQIEFECGLTTIGDEESFVIIKECSDNKDWYYKLTDDQRASIERGLKDVEEGRVTPHEEVMRRMYRRGTK